MNHEQNKQDEKRLEFIERVVITLIVISFLIVAYAKCQAQTQRQSIKVENQTLRHAIKELERLYYPVKFVYCRQRINSTQLISINIEHSTLDEALDQLLSPIGLTYKIYNYEYEFIVIAQGDHKTLVKKDDPVKNIAKPVKHKRQKAKTKAFEWRRDTIIVGQNVIL